MKRLVIALAAAICASTVIGAYASSKCEKRHHNCESRTAAQHDCEPKVVAHRGNWRAEGSAQNSIRSLVKADSVGAYASEFDVWLTADSVLVLNHDATINGHVIQQSPAAVILSQKLSNGELVPTLDAFLDSALTLDIRLVLELKEHSKPEVNQYAARRCVEMIGQKGLTDRTDYITFSPYAFEQFVKSAPANASYFLYELLSPEKIKELGGAGIDYNIGHFHNDPELTKRCHEMGLGVNIWTVDSDDDINFSIEQGVDFITTNEPERVARLIEKRRPAPRR